MMNTEKLNAILDTLNLTGGVAENARALVERMGASIEGIGDRPLEWRPTNLRLVQATTSREGLPKGAGRGDIVVGSEKVDTPFKVIPILTWGGRQMWSPDQNEAKLLCSSPDGVVGYLGYDCKTCPHAKWEDENGEKKKADCGTTVEALATTPDLKDVFKMTFSKTNYAVGKNWIKLQREALTNPYKRVYNVSSETNPTFKQVELLKVEVIGDASKDTPKEILPFVEELFNIARADRQEHLTAFHSMVKSRRESNSTLLEAPANTVMIEVSTETTPVAEGDATDSGAKSYSF